MTDRAIRWSFGAVVALLAAYAVTHLELSTDVTHFLPSESEAEIAVLASRLSDSELTRTMILTLRGPEIDDAVAAARGLAERLEGHPEIARLQGELEPERMEEVYQLYFPRRLLFLSSQPETDVPALFEDAALRERARQLKATLALPSSTLQTRLIPADPIGGFERVLQRLGAQRPPLESHDGHFVTRERDHAVLFLTTHHSAFDSAPQARLLAAIDAAFAAVAADAQGPIVLEASGANRFAVAAERSIRRDVNWIAAASFLGVALVFFAFLRSGHFFLLAVFPAVTGILVAAVALRATTGRLDGVTMAFGASLIGVAIDYSIHVLDHYRLHPDETGRAIVRRLWPSLAVGALTTMASFAGLSLTSFPGFREIGIFATLGVGSALLVTLFVLPAFLSNDGSPRPVPALASRVASGLGNALTRWRSRRGQLLWIPLVCVGAAATLLPQLRFEDDLSRLMSLDPELRAEEERVRARVAREESGRVIFALGDDFEAAIAANDAVALRLDAARAAGRVGDFRSLHSLLWSASLQERNAAAVAAIPDAAERVEAAFAAEGFRPEGLAPFRAALAEPPPEPLSPEALRASPLGALVTPLLLDLGDRAAAVTYLRGATDVAALEAELDGLARVHVFDQRSFMNAIFREFRTTTLQQIGVGCLLVLLVLGLRYRRVRPVLAAFVPSVLVAATVLAGFAALGVEVNLLHVTSLILVMGMGVDYGVFIVDSAGRRGHLDATLLSLLLSCLTTVFVFGTLAISEHGALRAIGATTGVGVLLSFVLAPVTLILLRPEPPRSGSTSEEPAA
ncbi:MAG: MMPL family transporter [Myxococcota bacterium]